MASISSPTGGKMTCYDDCYLCNWHMTGPWKRHKTYSGSEVWCGAGRPEFHSGGQCPARLPVVEVEFAIDEHPEILERWISDANTTHVGIKDEVADWMAKNIPKSRVEEHYDDLVCVRFDSPESYVLFKMFWL